MATNLNDKQKNQKQNAQKQQHPTLARHLVSHLRMRQQRKQTKK